MTTKTLQHWPCIRVGDAIYPAKPIPAGWKMATQREVICHHNHYSILIEELPAAHGSAGSAIIGLRAVPAKRRGEPDK